MKRTLIAALFCILVPTLLAESVVLTPVKDSDVYSFLNKPTGGAFDLGVSNTPDTIASLHSQKSLIQFDLTDLAIPAGEIGSAMLRLYSLAPDSAEGGGFRGGNLVVLRQGEAWGAVTSTYPNWNAIQPAGDPVAIFPVQVVDQWIEIDVTSLVTAWTAGVHPNHGFILQCEGDHLPPEETTNLLFGSMELGKAGKDAGLPEEQQLYPKLVITRAEAPALPPVLAISQGETGIVLEWPVAGSEGWTLETTENPAESWTAVTSGVVRDGGMWRIVQAPSASGRGFFRLTKP